jgi:spermidine synthase
MAREYKPKPRFRTTLRTGTQALSDNILRYYGEDCRIIETRRAAGRDAFLVVLEATMRGRPLRILGTIGRTRELMEHSAMDLQAPERLVFSYERVMLAALALAGAARRVLLLGLGGGAMWRHLDAYVPEAEVTAVERDRGVIAMAREHFQLGRRKIRRADAEEAVADYAGEFDAILVDLYDAGGAAPLGERFWRDCLDALRPDGALAINWAGGWSGAGSGGAHQRIARVAPDLPGSFFAAERSPRGNIVQFALASPGSGVPALKKRFEAFARAHGLPREDREALNHCDIGARYHRREAGASIAKKMGRGGFGG